VRPTIFDYLPTSDAQTICKMAEDESRAKRTLKSILSEVGGMGLGTLAGAGAAHYIDKAHQHLTKSPQFPQGKSFSPSLLLSAAPILGAGMGLAYNLAKARQQKELSSVGKDSHDNGERSVP
jgi:hypothetical protein